MPLSPHDPKESKRKDSLNPLLHFEILEREGNWEGLQNIQRMMKRIFAAVVNHPEISIEKQGEVCIVLSSDKDVQNLNLTFRGKNTPTNVLSFPSLRKRAIEDHPFIGDIIFAKETIEREAKESHITFANHLSHLTVHGLLHLMGYHHETEREAQIMEGLEIAILSELGISNPYLKIG